MSCNQKKLQTDETNQLVTTLIPHLFNWIRFLLLFKGFETQNPIKLSSSSQTWFPRFFAVPLMLVVNWSLKRITIEGEKVEIPEVVSSLAVIV